MVAAVRPRYHIKTEYIDCECWISREHSYGNGRIALQVLDCETGAPECTASVNMKDLDCPEGHTWIKDYSENAGIMSELIRHGIISKPVYKAQAGFVEVFLCKVLI